MKPELDWDHARHALTTIEDLGLQSLEQFNLLCQCLSPLGTAIKKGHINSPKNLRRRLYPLQTVSLAEIGGEKKKGEMTILELSRCVNGFASTTGNTLLDKEDILFYQQEENWYLMPTKPNIKVVLFSIYQWGTSVDWRMGCLIRNGMGWRRDDKFFRRKVSSECVIAIR